MFLIFHGDKRWEFENTAHMISDLVCSLTIASSLIPDANDIFITAHTDNGTTYFITYIKLLANNSLAQRKYYPMKFTIKELLYGYYKDEIFPVQ